MKAILLMVAALAVCIPGQSQDRSLSAARQALTDDLLSLSGKSPAPQLREQLVDHTFLVAESTHEPKRATVQSFVNELAMALAGRPLARVQAAQLAGEIVYVMQSAGTSTSGFFDAVNQFGGRLSAIGVSPLRAKSVAAQLERMGREVRGPDDFPVR